MYWLCGDIIFIFLDLFLKSHVALSIKVGMLSSYKRIQNFQKINLKNFICGTNSIYKGCFDPFDVG
jgi:hypothetical protein